VINFETYHEMRALSRELNLTPGQIAAKTGLNIKTIRKWLDKPRYEPRSRIQALQQARSLQGPDRLLAGKTSLHRDADLSTPAL
jgi:hypothetical protein